MREDKRKRLSAGGWKIGSAKEFLRLTDEEAAYIELKLRLAESVRDRRRRQGLTQAQFAQRLGSSQSRMAKMETGDPSVSFDLLIRSLLALGTTSRELSRIMSAPAAAS
jgi:DNA-binding XRE family transcriptional regulator